MKKLMLLLFFTVIISNDLQAQKRQKRVLIQQIAALKVYIDAAQEGYSIARKGLKVVGDLKAGEFYLHSDYLNSLKKVNPKVKKYSRVADIISLQMKITKNRNQTLKSLQQNDLFHSSELDYIARTYFRLKEDCNRIIDELIAVTMDGQLEMKDDERIQRIDMLYLTLNDNYNFCKSFNKQLQILCLSRVKEQKEVQTSKVLHNVLIN